MVVAKCVLCQKCIRGKSRTIGNGKFHQEAVHYAKSAGLRLELTSKSRLCSKCHVKVSREKL